GIGIEPDQADHLFQPFSQGEHSFSRRFGGTGLGLTLARRHARALGGDVTLLWSRPGEGSEFLVTLDAGPIGEVEWKTCYTEPPREVRADLQSVLEHRPLEGARVLLVEDGIDNQVLFTHFLESAGALVDQAENGLQAFHMACRQEYDVVLMDIQLPGLDG